MSVMLYIEITTSEEKIEDGKPFGWRKKESIFVCNSITGEERERLSDVLDANGIWHLYDSEADEFNANVTRDQLNGYLTDAKLMDYVPDLPQWDGYRDVAITLN